MDAKINLYIKILITHMVLYYIVLGGIYQSLADWYSQWPISWDLISRILLSPLIGVLGFYDGLPAFFLLPFSLLIFLVEYKKLRLYQSYIASVLTAHVVVLYIGSWYYKLSFSTNIWSNKWENTLEVSLLWLILPAIFVSSIGVRFLLKKHKYK